jgi:muconolactone delta-isomerase
MEVFEFWAGRPGGFAIVNVEDERELSQMMFEFPLTPFSVFDVRPIVEGDDALQRLNATVTNMLAQMQGPK